MMLSGFLFVHLAILLLAALLVVAAAVSDVRRLTIPNQFCFGLVLLFPLFVLTAPYEIAWQHHFGVGLVVLLIGIALFAGHLAGAGDIKMLAALALWAGPQYIGALLVVTGLTGGVLALTVAARLYRRQAHAITADNKTKQISLLAHTPVPYGVAIATGGLAAFVLLLRPVLF